MSVLDQQRAWVLTRVVAGELAVAEAAVLMGLSERSVWRLRARFLAAGPDALVHGNRGRASPRRRSDAERERILGLARGRLAGANDCHLAELLAEEGITIGRSSLRRLLRSAGLSSPRRRRAPRHRSRRDRMPQAGLLLQVDGSRHDWLGERGPRLTLVGAIDDATGLVTAATFREQEDAAGYLEIVRDTVRRHGVPVALYHDRHTIFEVPERGALTLEEQLVDRRAPTQLGRALGELGIGSIAARSPQAKGRVERLWGTFQDRLVTELRIAGVCDRDAANRHLGRFVARFNKRFPVPPLNDQPAWRPLPEGVRLDHVCALKYRRVVAPDGTVRVGPLILQLPARANGRSRAGQRVELQHRLDGRLVVWDGEREVFTRPAPADPAQLRRLAGARIDLGSSAPSVGSLATPPPSHPWRRVERASKLAQQKDRERLPDSLTR